MVFGSFGRNERFKGECIELLEGTLYAFILKPMNTGILTLVSNIILSLF
jgi:hypothetical protein